MPSSNLMDSPSARTLLTTEDPAPFTVYRPLGASPLVIAADHAGRVLPHALGDLGVTAAELQRHIAWDIGIAEVSRRMAELLDAFLITQTYSRLVIDANRKPGSAQSIVTLSEHTAVPGNGGLTAEDAARRALEIFHPYHDRIRAELDARLLAQRPAVLIAMHSFTPVYKRNSRAMHAGVLYNRDARFAHAMLGLLRSEPGLVVGDNEPYAVSDETDYTVVVHGEQRKLLHVELEIRQDLIEHEAGQIEWAERMSRLLPLGLSLASEIK